MNDLSELSIDLVPCPRCAAKPGEPCRTTGGNRVTYAAHSGRTRAAAEAWRIGFDEGLEYALKHPESAARMAAKRGGAS